MATRDENVPAYIAVHPGTILKIELEERKISQTLFAEMTGVLKSHISEILNGKRPVTKAFADKVEKALGISSLSLVNLQTQYIYDTERLNSSQKRNITLISPQRVAYASTIA